jgi:hypothetical protein
VWALLFAMGLVPALGLLVVGRRHRAKPAALIALTLAAVHLMQASAGGADLSRLAFAAMPFVVVVVVARVALTDEVPVVLALVTLVGGTLVLWQPLATVVPGNAGYRDFYYPPSNAALVCGIVLIVIGAVLFGAYFARSRADEPGASLVGVETGGHGVGAIGSGRAGQDRDSLRKRRD